MTHVLITGGLGVIGSLYARHLMGHGIDVSVLDPAPEPRNDWMLEVLRERSRISDGKLLGVVRLPLQNALREDLTDLLSAVDGVLHAGAHTGIPHSEIDPDDDWRSNVDATRHLLETMRALVRPPPTVVLSSVKPYRVFHASLLTEQTVLEPDEPYAASKAAQSMLCMAYARSYGLPIVCFRCSNLYGPAPCHGPRHGWLTWFCIQAALGWPIEVQGTGKQSRDMLHSNDVNSAVDLAFAKIHQIKGKVFNLGGGIDNVVGVEEAAKECVRLGGGSASYAMSGKSRKNDDEVVTTDCSAYREATGWAPKMDPWSGMGQIVVWAQKNEEKLQEVYEEFAP
jgi:CDP-paratose 2-epimerase